MTKGTNEIVDENVEGADGKFIGWRKNILNDITKKITIFKRHIFWRGCAGLLGIFLKEHVKN